jgi:multidrug efflux system membrane fusion protein
MSEGALVSPDGSRTSLAVIQQVDEVYVDLKQPAERYEDLRNAFAERALQPEAPLPVTLLSLQGDALRGAGDACSSPTSAWTRAPASSRCACWSPTPICACCPACSCARASPSVTTRHAMVVPQQAVRVTPRSARTVLVVDTGDVVAVRTRHAWAASPTACSSSSRVVSRRATASSSRASTRLAAGVVRAARPLVSPCGRRRLREGD